MLSFTPRFQITSTPTVLNNDAYDANDVIVAETAITHQMFTQFGGPFKLEQIEFWDTNDQTAAILTFLFTSTNVVHGVKDSALSISDADSLFITGVYAAATAGQTDAGGVKYGLWNPGIYVQPSSGSIYYSISSAGTPTYLTGCITTRFTFSA